MPLKSISKESLINATIFMLPFCYLLFVTLPKPFGFGLQFGNDFPEHRIWWMQTQSFFIWNGYFPLWNPSEEFGTLYPGSRGMSLLYPLNWWLYIPSYFGGVLNYISQYIHVAAHAAIGLFGLYRLIVRKGNVSKEAAALGCIVFLVNQRFNDFVRYPNGIEAMAWVPWVFYFAVSILEEEHEKTKISILNNVNKLHFLGLILVSSLMWLAGYGHFSYIMTIALGILCLILGKTICKKLIVFCGFLAGMLVASGPLIATSIAVNEIPERCAGNIEFADACSLSVSYLDMFTHPFCVNVHASSFFLPVFVGLLLIGVISAIFRSSGWRLHISMFVILVVIADLSRGSDGYLFRIFHEYVPMYHAFRIQGRNNWISMIPIAWFSAQGAEICIKKGPLRTICIALLVLLCGIFILHHLSTNVSLYEFSPILNKCVDINTVTQRVLLLVIGGTTLVVIYAICSSTIIRMTTLLGLVLLFVTGYGLSASWFNKTMSPVAKWSIPEMFSEGLLSFVERGSSNRLKGPLFIGNYEYAPVYDTYMKTAQNSTFPGSQFVFSPNELAVEKADARILMQNFGPNHIYFTISTNTQGDLLYFSTYSKFWDSNIHYRRGKHEYSKFTVLPVNKGTTEVRMVYRPLLLIVLLGLNIILLGVLMAAINFKRGKKAHLIFTSIFFLIVFIFFVFSTFNRNSLDSRVLYGSQGNKYQSFVPVPVLRGNW